MEENRAEVNFELVERLAEREERTGPTLAGFATSGRRVGKVEPHVELTTIAYSMACSMPIAQEDSTVIAFAAPRPDPRHAQNWLESGLSISRTVVHDRKQLMLILLFFFAASWLRS